MRKNLFEFLFGKSCLGPDLSNPSVGEQVVRLFEEADAAEMTALTSSKQPLVKALKSIGVDGTPVMGASWAELHFEDGDAYREALRAVYEPDALHKLAVAGWVPAKCGDQAQANEPADYKLGFIELSVAETGDSDKVPDDEKLRKEAQKADTTPEDRDDELNPVENPDKVFVDDNQTGVSKATDGKDPEGKPKGVSEGRHKDGCTCGFCANKGRFGKKAKKPEEGEKPEEGGETTESNRAKAMVDHLLEMTSAGAIPAFDGPPPAARPKPRLHFHGRHKTKRP